MGVKNITTIKSIKRNFENETLGEAIDIILKRKTHNTARAYKNAYKDFFMFIFNKDYKDCSWEDLKKINYTDILEYVEYMERYLSYNTVSLRMGALQSLGKELNKIKENCINTFIFSVKLNQKNKKDNEYGAFTFEEAMNLLEYTKSLNTEKSFIQYLFFKTTLNTAHRVSSLLNITWKDIKLTKEDNTDVWVINTYDKTNFFKTPISNELFQELKENLFENDLEDKVFKISSSTLNRTLSSFCKEFNINQEERKLVLHSLKKTSGDIAYLKSNGDIVKIASHLHHNNINTCYKSYLGKERKLKEHLSYNLFDNNNDLDKEIDTLVLNLDKNSIINILKNCNDVVKQAIIDELKTS